MAVLTYVLIGVVLLGVYFTASYIKNNGFLDVFSIILGLAIFILILKLIFDNNRSEFNA